MKHVQTNDLFRVYILYMGMWLYYSQLFSVKNKICNLGSQLNLNDEGIPNFKENVLSIGFFEHKFF